MNLAYYSLTNISYCCELDGHSWSCPLCVLSEVEIQTETQNRIGNVKTGLMLAHSEKVNSSGLQIKYFII